MSAPSGLRENAVAERKVRSRRRRVWSTNCEGCFENRDLMGRVLLAAARPITRCPEAQPPARDGRPPPAGISRAAGRPGRAYPRATTTSPGRTSTPATRVRPGGASRGRRHPRCGTWCGRRTPRRHGDRGQPRSRKRSLDSPGTGNWAMARGSPTTSVIHRSTLSPGETAQGEAAASTTRACAIPRRPR